MMARTRNLTFAAAENVARNLAAYGTAAAGLVCGLTLLLAGVAIHEGVKSEARAAVQDGAHVYCTWDMFGRDHPLPDTVLERLATIDGVERVVPRVIGRVALQDEHPLVIGVPLAELARATRDADGWSVEGSLPDDPAEVLIGRELAAVLGLRVGSTLALEAGTIRLFSVSGITPATASLWSAKAIVCDIEEAQLAFGETEHVSDACLYVRAGYETLVAEAVGRTDHHLRVQTREVVLGYVAAGMTRRVGVFTVLFALALVFAIPAFAVTTYLGHTPRRREIGLLKAEGWRTADVLLMVALENVIVSIFAAALATLLALVWVEALRAPLIASFFLADLPLFPEMHIPARFLPLAPVLALVFSLVVTMTGSIYTTWRTAITRPVEVLR
ncbi:MAG: FtsX-like permease family protein [bacterium]|nr:FtsX-like permease family protein [bacterium]